MQCSSVSMATAWENDEELKAYIAKIEGGDEARPQELRQTARSFSVLRRKSARDLFCGIRKAPW